MTYRIGFFLRQTFFSVICLWYFFKFFVSVDKYPGEVHNFFVPDANLLNLAKTASKHGFKTFFFLNAGVFGCNSKPLKHMKRYF